MTSAMNLPRQLLLLLVLTAAANVHAQSEVGAQTADVSFFNATIAEVPLYVDWSGQSAFPDGLAP